MNILNSKERKLLRQQLHEQFGITELYDENFAYFTTGKDKLYVANKSCFDDDHQILRVNHLGLYLGQYMKDGFRLSLEGAQRLGPHACKNVIDVDEQERNAWFIGEDISHDEHEGAYVLLRCGDDYLGCGKVKDGKILNYLSKSRKLVKVFSDE